MEAYLKFLAAKFVFDEVEANSPNKAINNLVFNPCGDSELLHRLLETYDLVTFTDGQQYLRKNGISSLITAAGIQCQAIVNVHHSLECRPILKSHGNIFTITLASFSQNIVLSMSTK